MPVCPNDLALEALLRLLGASGYRFTAVTPATHARVMSRRGEATTLRDIFGWNLPFRPELLPAELAEALAAADAAEEAGDGRLRSRLRVASAGGRLFLHSAFPTEAEDAVFFGPDTYRFIDFVTAALPRIRPVRHLVDFGAGSGAGGIVAAARCGPERLSLCDINAQALRLAAVNARAAGVAADPCRAAGPAEVPGPVDLIIANPPYMLDEGARTYRDGGGMHGAQLSLDWVLAAADRLEKGGHMLLYTGVAMVDGRDSLREALEAALPALGCTLRYREIDPDVFGEELDKPSYRDVERIAAVGAIVRKG